MYTGTSDGKILDIKDRKISVLATLGRPPCGMSGIFVVIIYIYVLVMS